ncbi:MAG: transcription initiation factor TFIIIB Brf1 subunit/transcription initiation factor TFIIB [Natronomonas sp.]|jgi:transcription initiation factor TFIIIB Brf1 subunit/transcription initiation factor TFIIB
MTERIQTQETEEETADESLACPECGGNVVAGGERGETVCTGCGLVAEDGEVGRGPEWRAFDSTEREKKSHVASTRVPVSPASESRRSPGHTVTSHANSAWISNPPTTRATCHGLPRSLTAPRGPNAAPGNPSGRSKNRASTPASPPSASPPRSTPPCSPTRGRRRPLSATSRISRRSLPSRHHELLEAEQDLPGV